MGVQGITPQQQPLSVQHLARQFSAKSVRDVLASITADVKDVTETMAHSTAVRLSSKQDKQEAVVARRQDGKSNLLVEQTTVQGREHAGLQGDPDGQLAQSLSGLLAAMLGEDEHERKKTKRSTLKVRMEAFLALEGSITSMGLSPSELETYQRLFKLMRQLGQRQREDEQLTRQLGGLRGLMQSRGLGDAGH